MTATKGVIRSHTLPSTNKYNSHTNCSWSFRQQAGILRVKFNKFNLEPSPDCTKDYVLIQDGAEATSPVLGRFCGDTFTRELNSTGHEMLITFVSDDQNNFAGFELAYERFVQGNTLDYDRDI